MQAAGWGWALALIRALSPAQKGSLLPCHPHSKGAASPDLAVGEAVRAEVWAEMVLRLPRPPLPLCCPFSFKASQAWVAHGSTGREASKGAGPAHLQQPCHQSLGHLAPALPGPHQFSLLPSPWVKPWRVKGKTIWEMGAKTTLGEVQGGKETTQS